MNNFENILYTATQHERKLKEMYQLFSETFIEDRDFWQKISREEEAHAQLIENILKLYHHGDIQRKELALKVQAIKFAIDYLDSIIARCEKNEVSRIQALGLAHDVENGFIENKTFQSLNFMSGRYKDIGTRLEEATAKHRDRILERLNYAKKKVETSPTIP